MTALSFLIVFAASVFFSPFCSCCGILQKFQGNMKYACYISLYGLNWNGNSPVISPEGLVLPVAWGGCVCPAALHWVALVATIRHQWQQPLLRPETAGRPGMQQQRAIPRLIVCPSAFSSHHLGSAGGQPVSPGSAKCSNLLGPATASMEQGFCPPSPSHWLS